MLFRSKISHLVSGVCARHERNPDLPQDTFSESLLECSMAGTSSDIVLYAVGRA